MAEELTSDLPVSLEIPGPAREHHHAAKIGTSPAAQLEQALAHWRHASLGQRAVRPALVTLDLLVLALCFILARSVSWFYNDVSIEKGLAEWWNGAGEIRVTLFAFIAIGMVAWIAAVCGHYTPGRRKPWSDELRQLLGVIIVGAMLDAMLVFLGKWQFSRLWLGSTWLMVFITLPLLRLLAKRWFLRRGCLTRPYVLIGSPATALEAAQALASEPLMGYRPIALVTPCATNCSECLDLGCRKLNPIPVCDEVLQLLKAPGDYQIVIALDADPSGPLKPIMQTLMLSRDDLLVVPPLAGLPLLGMELSHFFSHDLLLLRARNNLKRRAPQAIKRLSDVIGAALLLVFLAPLFAWVALRIRLESSGPVFFWQERVGYDGLPFCFIKFRSMVTNADEVLERWKQSHPELYATYVVNNFKLAEDPRVTKVGRWIRRTSIDELPQLWNVLKGDMSLVGPRPLLARELDDYGDAIDIYRGARPGITGLWQISGRSLTTFEQRIGMDRWYLRNWSLWYDMVILFRTVRVVLKSEGAY